VSFCPFCKAPVCNLTGREIYHNRPDLYNLFDKRFVACSNFPRCDSYVGCHDDGTPLGTLADGVTRRLRVSAHTAFDSLWKGDDAVMSRNSAYQWLRKLFEAADVVHIGSLYGKACERIIEAVRIFWLSQPDNWKDQKPRNFPKSTGIKRF
jgi:hypothetical protein